MNSDHMPEAWQSWEIDPSTRQSVHVWTKYIPIDVQVGTTAVDLLAVDRGVPAVNLVQNPSIELNALTEFTVVGSAISRSNAVTAASGTYSLLVNPANAAAGEGFYYTAPILTGHPEGTQLTAQCEVRGASASGDVKIEIRSVDAAGTETVLTTSATHSLTTSFARIFITANVPRLGATYRVYVVSVAQHNINFYVDKLMVERRNDGYLTDYVDGSLGRTYEWYGTAHASESKRRADLSVVRGFKLKNGHGSQTVNIALDTTATAAGAASTGVLLKAGETFETNWPIDVRTNISALASGASTQVYGVVYGVHQG